MKIKEMSKKYSSYRKTRRDGSCFYRALLYRAFEVIILKNDQKLKERLIKKLKGAKDFLKKAGFEGFIFEDIQDLFISKI
jgi:ubiquitin thioesterase protein OTUB1